MAYDKTQVFAFADAVFDGVHAVRDGVGVEDTGAAISLFTALASCVDEFKDDTDAAALHFVSRLTDRFGDQRMNPTPEG
jgi:hypothetical protein